MADSKVVDEPNQWDDLASNQSEFNELGIALSKLNPKLNLLDTSDDQKIVQSKVTEIQARQRELSQWFGEFLDGPLAEQQADLDRRYLVTFDDLSEASLIDLNDACLVMANVNKMRVDLHQELTRCSRFAGRAKPGFPRFPGIFHPYEITDPAKIRQAILGLGQHDGRGRGQRSTWGGVPANLQEGA